MLFVSIVSMSCSLFRREEEEMKIARINFNKTQQNWRAWQARAALHSASKPEMTK